MVVPIVTLCDRTAFIFSKIVLYKRSIKQAYPSPVSQIRGRYKICYVKVDYVMSMFYNAICHWFTLTNVFLANSQRGHFAASDCSLSRLDVTLLCWSAFVSGTAAHDHIFSILCTTAYKRAIHIT